MCTFMNIQYWVSTIFHLQVFESERSIAKLCLYLSFVLGLAGKLSMTILSEMLRHGGNRSQKWLLVSELMHSSCHTAAPACPTCGCCTWNAVNKSLQQS